MRLLVANGGPRHDSGHRLGLTGYSVRDAVLNWLRVASEIQDILFYRIAGRAERLAAAARQSRTELASSQCARAYRCTCKR